MLAEYYFKIKYVKGTDNIRADTLSKKVKLRESEKLLNAILRINKDGKIQYNYLKLVEVYKVLKLYKIKKIKKVQQQDLNSKDYKYKELIYILKDIIKEFIKNFYKGLI